MLTKIRLLWFAVLFTGTCTLAQTTTTLNETSNNTAACSAISGYCDGVFTGMSSSSCMQPGSTATGTTAA